MFCTNCGKQLKEGSIFCNNCGAKLKSTDIQTIKEADSKKDKLQFPTNEIITNINGTVEEMQEDYTTKFETETNNESSENKVPFGNAKNEEKDPNKFEFLHHVANVYSKSTKIELRDQIIHVEQSTPFLMWNFFRKNKDIFIRDVANITLKKNIGIWNLSMGIVILILAIMDCANSGISLFNIVIGIFAVGFICYRYFTLSIYDRNNRVIKIAIGSDEEESERFIQAINKALDENNIPRYNPADFKEPFYQSNSIKILLAGMSIVILLLATGLFSLDDVYINTVKNSSWEAYPTATVGEILGYSIENITWESIEQSSGRNIVQAYGYLSSGKYAKIQFLMDSDGENFKLYSIDIDGEPYNDEFSQGLVIIAFISNYDDNWGDGTFGEKINDEIRGAYAEALLENMYW